MVSKFDFSRRVLGLSLLAMSVAMVCGRAALAQETGAKATDAETPAAGTEQPAAEGQAGAQGGMTEEEFRQIFEEAPKALEAGDYEKALTLYDKIIPVLSNSIQGLVQLPGA